jgi:ADP-heptose:LPS heptosyltransferase
MTGHRLVVRLDSLGDMLAAGPAIRAVANGSDRVTVLAGPLGAGAAQLLPCVDTVLVWSCPWILNPAPPVDSDEILDLVRRIGALRIDEAVVLTSFHQSPLPTALLLRMAGVSRIAASSEDYPGSLLNLRLPVAPDAPEPERMLAVARAAGYELPPGDGGRLAVRRPLPIVDLGLGARYLVVHPGTSAPARAYPPQLWGRAVAELSDAGWSVAVTGGPSERELTADVAAHAATGAPVLDLGGALELPELAGVLDRAAVVVVANTGPAHLAAAVGTPVVSLFAPVVPAVRWAPYGVPVIILGDQEGECRDSRRQQCPIPGHPCLSTVTAAEIRCAVESLSAAESFSAAQSPGTVESLSAAESPGTVACPSPAAVPAVTR